MICPPSIYNFPDSLTIYPIGLCRQNLRAVKDGRVAVVDGSQHFNRPGPRLVDALEWLTGLLNDRPDMIPSGFPWTWLKDMWYCLQGRLYLLRVVLKICTFTAWSWIQNGAFNPIPQQFCFLFLSLNQIRHEYKPDLGDDCLPTKVIMLGYSIS